MLRWRLTDRSMWPAAAEWFLLLRPVLGQGADDGTTHGTQEGVAGLLADIAAGQASTDRPDEASLTFGGRIAMILLVSGKC